MNPSINALKASDGSGNASVATVSNTRAPLATTIQVDTVQGINNHFFGTMGTPHTFTDPVTGETITVISEATAVDFRGHVDGSNLEIDEIAPGYTDAGSSVGDIVIIRPTTQWGDQVAEVLEVSHNDDGTFKNDSISDQQMFTDPLDPVLRASEVMFDHVASGCVITGDSYGSNRNASMTAGVVYINGKRYVVNAVTARTYTASKDTYIDAPIPASGNTIANADLVYTEVANNAASPALAANSIRLGIIVSGANIAAAGSVNQGQEDKVLPIASSIPYAVTDSLGNLICPRDPNRKVLGYRQVVSSQNTVNGSPPGDLITGLTCPFIVPTGRKVKIILHFGEMANTTANDGGGLAIVQTSIAGTVLARSRLYAPSPANNVFPCRAETVKTLSGSQTVVGGVFTVGGGTLATGAAAITPGYLTVELV